MIQLGIFILLTVFLLIFTLKRPHQHRIPRFFAFESIFILILLNVSSWFQNPFSLRQIISWIFPLSSAALAFHGFRLLRIAGFPKNDFEDTTKLVTIGAYRYIRHPLYCTLLLGGIGVFLKSPSYIATVVFLILVVFVFLTGKIEEEENLERFSEEYRVYMKKTKMFIPFLI